MITPLSAIAIRFLPGRWAVPENLRAQVPAIWAKLKSDLPALWDGRILGVSGEGGGLPTVVDGVLRGEAREDAYSAFLAWRFLGFPEIGIRNLFGSAIVVSADNAVLLGRMGAATANAGMVYPPGGTLEPGDIDATGMVDVVGSIIRELREETGLSSAAARRGKLFAIFDGPRLSVAQFFHFPQDADTLRAEILDNLARQPDPELADIVIIRKSSDLSAHRSMPYVAELVAAMEAGTLP